MRLLQVILVGDLDEYLLMVEDWFDSYYFMVWEWWCWFNSDMCLYGMFECWVLFFDLINISYDQVFVGMFFIYYNVLVKMLFVDLGYFVQLCKLEFGLLYKWMLVWCGVEIWLMYLMVLWLLIEVILWCEDYCVWSEVVSVKKCFQCLWFCLVGIYVFLVENDGVVFWIDGWLQVENCEYWLFEWIQCGIEVWMGYVMELNLCVCCVGI